MDDSNMTIWATVLQSKKGESPVSSLFLLFLSDFGWKLDDWPELIS